MPAECSFSSGFSLEQSEQFHLFLIYFGIYSFSFLYFSLYYWTSSGSRQQRQQHHSSHRSRGAVYPAFPFLSLFTAYCFIFVDLLLPTFPGLPPRRSALSCSRSYFFYARVAYKGSFQLHLVNVTLPYDEISHLNSPHLVGPRNKSYIGQPWTHDSVHSSRCAIRRASRSFLSNQRPTCFLSCSDHKLTLARSLHSNFNLCSFLLYVLLFSDALN
jgi:hypothetical protein